MSQWKSLINLYEWREEGKYHYMDVSNFVYTFIYNVNNTRVGIRIKHNKNIMDQIFMYRKYYSYNIMTNTINEKIKSVLREDIIGEIIN